MTVLATRKACSWMVSKLRCYQSRRLVYWAWWCRNWIVSYVIASTTPKACSLVMMTLRRYSGVCDLSNSELVTVVERSGHIGAGCSALRVGS